MKNILHFLGPMCFEKITQVSIYFSNLVYSGNTVTYVGLQYSRLEFCRFEVSNHVVPQEWNTTGDPEFVIEDETQLETQSLSLKMNTFTLSFTTYLTMLKVAKV